MKYKVIIGVPFTEKLYANIQEKWIQEDGSDYVVLCKLYIINYSFAN
jgi:hypothetical protein